MLESTVDTMRRIEMFGTPPSPILFIFLPCAYGTADDFVKHGFPNQLTKLGIAADSIMIDAHMDDYTNGRIIHRLRNEVLKQLPLHKYSQVWLIGISLGGYGAALLAMLQSIRQAELTELTGVFLIAPFLGSRHIPAEIVSAGGLKAWSTTHHYQDASVTLDSNIDWNLWDWFKHHQSFPTAPRVCLGYGTDDRFRVSHELLADHLDIQNVWSVSGGHSWPIWTQLWEAFLFDRPWLKRNKLAVKKAALSSFSRLSPRSAV